MSVKVKKKICFSFCRILYVFVFCFSDYKFGLDRFFWWIDIDLIIKLKSFFEWKYKYLKFFLS